MADRVKLTAARHVFKKSYATLGESLQGNLPTVVSELYSAGLISQTTKDKVVSDSSTPTHDKALGVLNEIEGKIKLNEHILEDFLDILCGEQIDLGHVASSMRQQYQLLCDRKEVSPAPSTTSDYTDNNKGGKSGLVVGGNTCIVARNGSYPQAQGDYRRVTGELFGDSASQESRPKYLQFQHFSGNVEDNLPASQDSTTPRRQIVSFDKDSGRDTSDLNLSVVPFGDLSQEDACKKELKTAFDNYVTMIAESGNQKVRANQQEFEEKVTNVKKQYESQMAQSQKEHQQQVKTLIKTLETHEELKAIQKEKICRMEKELEEIHQNFDSKSQEVERLRQTLAERETELDQMKDFMEVKEQELKRIKNCEPETCAPSTVEDSKTVFKKQIALCDQVLEIAKHLSECSLEDIPKLKRDIMKKVDQIITPKQTSKKRRWTTL